MAIFPRIFGNYRIKLVNELFDRDRDYNTELYEKLRELRITIYTTNLTTTPDSYLEMLCNILDEYAPIKSTFEFEFAYALEYDTNSSQSDKFTLTLSFITNILMGRNDVWFPSKISHDSSELVWRVIFELLRRCDSYEYIDHSYQDVIEHCYNIIQLSEHETVLSCCGMIMLLVIKNDEDNKIALHPFDEITTNKVRRICNADFQGERLIYEMTFHELASDRL